MRKTIVPLVLILATSGFAEEGRVEIIPRPAEPQFDARLGVGFMLSPELFALKGSVEYRFDRFFAAGPALTMGFDSEEQVFLPVLAFRFIVPAQVLKENLAGWPDLEFSLHAGFGAVVRDEGGFQNTDFAFQTGLNADYFILPELTVGLGGDVIVTGSARDRSAGLLYAQAAYHF